MAVRISPMALADSAAVSELSGQLGYPVVDGAVSRRFLRMTERGHAIVLVADADAHVVGWIHVVVTPVLEADLYAEIAGLIVDDRRRSRGIGAELLRAGEQWAREAGCTAMRVRSRLPASAPMPSTSAAATLESRRSMPSRNPWSDRHAQQANKSTSSSMTASFVSNRRFPARLADRVRRYPLAGHRLRSARSDNVDQAGSQALGLRPGAVPPGRQHAGPARSLRSAGRRRPMGAAQQPRHLSYSLPERRGSRRRRLAHRRRFLRRRRIDAAQRQLAWPRSADALPLLPSRRGGCADAYPSRLASAGAAAAATGRGGRAVGVRSRVRIRMSPPTSRLRSRPESRGTSICATRFSFTPRSRTTAGRLASWRNPLSTRPSPCPVACRRELLTSRSGHSDRPRAYKPR